MCGYWEPDLLAMIGGKKKKKDTSALREENQVKTYGKQRIKILC